MLTFKFLNKGAVKFQFNRTLLVKETDNANVPFILYLTKKNKDLNRAVYDTRFFFVYKKFLGWGDGAPSKVGKTFGLKEHLQMYLHLSTSKGTSGARIWVLSNSKPVILPLDQAFGVYDTRFDANSGWMTWFFIWEMYLLNFFISFFFF